jgi:hypothetical protein
MRRYLLFFLLIFQMVFLPAQDSLPNCKRSFPSLIELVSGDYASPAGVHREHFTYAVLQPCTADAYYTPAQTQVMQLLAGGNVAAALDSLSAVPAPLMASSSTFRILQAGSEYLLTYTKGNVRNPDKAPLFEGFNGGFASYIEGVFRWDTLSSLPSSELDKVIVTWMEVLYRGDDKMPGIYFEMLGDVMLRYGNPQVSRWVAAMAYLRAGEDYRNDTIMGRYKTKAIYALESHQKKPTTFNRYRLNQLVTVFHATWLQGEALRDSIKGLTWQSDPAPEFQRKFTGRTGALGVFGSFDDLPADARNPLVELLEKDRKIYGDIAENDPNRETMNRDLDVNKIKAVPAYNVFAIIMILLVIGSALFFFLRIRKRQQEMDVADALSDLDDETKRNLP